MFSLKDENKIVKVLLSLVCGIFFILCVYSIFKHGNSTLLGDLEKFNDDDAKYIRSAWTLVEQGILVYKFPPNPTVFIMPGLPYVLAFFIAIFGKFSGIVAFRIFQALIQTLSLLLVFFIARKFLNSKVAVTAFIINALYIPEVWVSNMILTESIFKFLLLCLVYFSMYAIEKNKTKYYVFGGIFYGLCALFRPTITLYPVIILIGWIKYKYRFKEILKYTLIVVVIFSAIMTPWWVRNYRIFHKFIPFTLSSGNPMLDGTYLNNNDATLDAIEGIKFPDFHYSDNDEIENNRIEVENAKYRIKNAVLKRPLTYAYWYTLGKTVYMWIFPFYFQGIFGIKYFPTIYHWMLLALSFAGLIFYYSNKSRKKSYNILLCVMVYFNCIHLPFFCFARYIYPIFPFAMIFAAFGLLEITRVYNTRHKIKKTSLTQ